MPKIPARYIGKHTVVLRPLDGPFLNGAGEKLTSLILYPGDTLLMPETEILGQTFLVDLRRDGAPARHLGAGRVVLPEHDGLSDDALYALGYEFQEGRADFEPCDPLSAVVATIDAPPADTASAVVSLSATEAVPAKARRGSVALVAGEE